MALIGHSIVLSTAPPRNIFFTEFLNKFISFFVKQRRCGWLWRMFFFDPIHDGCALVWLVFFFFFVWLNCFSAFLVYPVSDR